MQDAKARFIKSCKEALDIITLIDERAMFYTGRFIEYETVIFEGSQGILLDMDFGFFPNVTRTHTTSKNAFELIDKYYLSDDKDDRIQTYYVTRAYQTRHGAGYMTNQRIPRNIKDNPLETNVNNEWQSKFRTSVLDLDLINYALDCDSNFNHGIKNLVVTCLDQIEGKIKMTKDGGNIEMATDDINTLTKHIHIPFKDVYTSISDVSHELESFR